MSYREPDNFEGTPGEWAEAYGDKSGNFGIFSKEMIEKRLVSPTICFISPADKVDKIDKANARLIAESKNIARHLQYFINAVENGKDLFPEIWNAKDTLKRAGL